jgi:hypothetical protein
MSVDSYSRWPHQQYVATLPNDASSEWRSRRVWFAPPEALSRLLPSARNDPAGVAGVIVLDPPCLMYKARGGAKGWGNTYRNDRPQYVVNFRAALDVGGWQPPFLLLTTKPAKSVSTIEVARAFCLNQFRFIEGNSFGCWDVPIEPDESHQEET